LKQSEWWKNLKELNSKKQLPNEYVDIKRGKGKYGKSILKCHP